MRSDFEHIVIGGGISGLGLAHRAVRKGVGTLVLESAPQVGGCINSLSFPQCGDFWAEGGSHTCFNSYGRLLDTLDDLGMLERLTPKAKLRYWLWREDRRRSIFSSLNPVELALSLPRLVTRKKKEQSVADYYGAVLGRRNYRNLFGPAFRAVICQHADDFPADLLFRRKPRRKDVLRSFTLPNGLSEIPLAITAQRDLSIRTGQEASALYRDGDGFRVRLQNGEELSCSYLSLAVPPDVAARLLAPDLGELAMPIREIGMAEVESLALCVAADRMAHLPPLAGLIAVDDAFYSMVSRDYISDAHYRGFTFHFRSGAVPPREQLQRACAALGIRQDAIDGMQRANNRLPALRVGHETLVERIDAILGGIRLAITGNWFYGVSIEDCLIRSHQEYERLFGSERE